MESFWNTIDKIKNYRWDIIIPTTTVGVVGSVSLGLLYVFRHKTNVKSFDNYVATRGMYWPMKLKAPSVQGPLLALMIRLVEFPIIGERIVKLMLKNAGFEELDALVVDKYTPILKPTKPFPYVDSEGKPIYELKLKRIVSIMNNKLAIHQRNSRILELHKLYSSQEATPSSIAKSLVENMKTLNPKYNAFFEFDVQNILDQAAASTERYKNGNQLSVFDGVFLAVKDSLDAFPYATTYGTRVFSNNIFMESMENQNVKNARALGAIIIGKTTMPEVGIQPFSYNSRYGYCKNPYNLDFCTGGSSAGSACATALNLATVSYGTDGGGSIRIPASFCGLYGLKTTYGRLNGTQFSYATEHSVGVTGPIAATAVDLALTFAVMNNGLSKEFETITNESKLRFGYDANWNNDSKSQFLVSTYITSALTDGFPNATFKNELRIPALNLIKLSHFITISTNMSVGLNKHYIQHREKLDYVTRMTLMTSNCHLPKNYLKAAQLKSALLQYFDENIWTDYDIIVTPTTGDISPNMSKVNLKYGSLNFDHTSSVMRFAQIGNFLGYPAITIPIGKSANEVPVGIQLMANHHREELLLKAAILLRPSFEEKPKDYFNLN